MDRVVVTRSVLGFTHMQVCAVADATDAEILELCNLKNPAGTTHGWAAVDRETQVTCESHPDRKHFLVTC